MQGVEFHHVLFTDKQNFFQICGSGCLEGDGSVGFPNISRFFSSKNAVYNVEKVNLPIIAIGSFRHSAGKDDEKTSLKPFT